MPACPLGSTYVRTTSNMACHYHPWTAYTVRQHWVWPVIISLEHITWSDNVERGMPSWSSGSTHGHKASVLACNHVIGQLTQSEGIKHNMPSCLWTTHTIGLRRAWHAIMVLGQHTQPEGGEHDMPSSRLDNKHGSTILNMVSLHRLWIAHTVRLR